MDGERLVGGSEQGLLRNCDLKLVTAVDGHAVFVEKTKLGVVKLYRLREFAALGRTCQCARAYFFLPVDVGYRVKHFLCAYRRNGGGETFVGVRRAYAVNVFGHGRRAELYVGVVAAEVGILLVGYSVAVGICVSVKAEILKSTESFGKLPFLEAHLVKRFVRVDRKVGVVAPADDVGGQQLYAGVLFVASGYVVVIQGYLHVRQHAHVGKTGILLHNQAHPAASAVAAASLHGEAEIVEHSGHGVGRNALLRLIFGGQLVVDKVAQAFGYAYHRGQSPAAGVLIVYLCTVVYAYRFYARMVEWAGRHSDASVVGGKGVVYLHRLVGKVEVEHARRVEGEAVEVAAVFRGHRDGVAHHAAARCADE